MFYLCSAAVLERGVNQQQAAEEDTTSVLLVGAIKNIIWASTRENLFSGVCKQHRRRPACASAQTDQRLCYSLIEKNHILTCYEGNFNFLASLCSWGDWFETCYVGNPEDRFSRDEAHLSFRICQFYT